MDKCRTVPRNVHISLILIHLFIALTSTSRVIDFGEKLPDLIKDHPNKSWLIKFYATWCHHCQKLEPTYINVAEKIYHRHDHLVVGQVDCSKYPNICETFNVQSYPTIIFINKHTRALYYGDRSLETLIEFAERLNGPDYREVDNCNVKELTEDHPLVVLSTVRDLTSKLHSQFTALSRSQKANFWFYRLNRQCNNSLEADNLYILKRYLDKPIEFKNNDSDMTEADILNWLDSESFPIYGQVHRYNFDKTIASGKQLVMAVLDRYDPARKFTLRSAQFHKIFRQLAKELAQSGSHLLYAWTSDLDLVRMIIVRHVLVPNLIIVRPDYSFNIIIKNPQDLEVNGEDELPQMLSAESIKSRIKMAEEGKLIYEGGNNLINEIWRKVFNNYHSFIDMFRSNPLLSTILVGLPTLVISFVIYMTCCHDGRLYDEVGDDDEEEDENGNGDDIGEDEELRRLLNHVKQD